MAVNMISATFSHQDACFDPAEFINRGRFRAEKNANLEEAARDVEGARQHLKKQIQKLLESIHEHEKKNIGDFLKPIQSPSVIKRFYEWLKGTARDQHLEQAITQAGDLCSEARIVRHAINSLSQAQFEYERNAAHYWDAARDARDHSERMKRGWTWWR